MGTTDLHAQLLAHDYYADVADIPLGLTRVATLIRQARAEVEETGGLSLLLDNGDGLQGGALGEDILLGAQATHPLMTAFGVLGYDAIGLGNHDFNYGIPTLERVMQDAPCPVICSNMKPVTANLNLPFQAHAVIEKPVPQAPDLPPLRIGILSVVPPQTLIWDAYFLAGQVVVQDMIAAATETTAFLRQKGCDLVIALAHTGLGEQDPAENMENALYPLSTILGIDAVIAGHTHLALPDAKHPLPRPVVMPGAFGSHLGLVDIDLQWNGTGWAVKKNTPLLRAVAPAGQKPVAEDPSLKAALEQDHRDTRTRLSLPVGEVSAPLHSFFTFIAHDRSLEVAACAQAAAVRAKVRDTDAAHLPILSAVAPGKFGARSGPRFYTDVPAGPVTLRHVTDLQIFPNRLHAVEVTGAQLLDWLEMSAGVFNQITPGSQDQFLLDDQRAGHNYDVIFGVEYDINLAQPARFNSAGALIHPRANRIRNLRWNGAPVSADQRFLVAMNSYRASGGGNFNMLRDAQSVPMPSVRLRDVTKSYLAGELEPDPLAQAPSPWTFQPLDNTQVIALTGPAARAHLAELPSDRVSALELDENGFLPLKLRLY